MSELGSSHRPRDLIPVYLGLAFLACFWLLNSGIDVSEATDHFKVAEQILKKGELGFANKGVLGIKDPADSTFAEAPTGRIYGAHEIGNSLSLLPLAGLINVITPVVVQHFPRLAAPPASSYGEGRPPPTPEEQIGRVLRSYQAGIIWALTLVGLYLLLTKRLGISSGLAVTTLVLMTATSYLIFYSHFLFDGNLVALLWVVCLCFHLDYLKTLELRKLVFSMIAAGFMVITRLTSVLLLWSVLGWCLYVWFRQPQRTRFIRHLIVAGLVLLPFALWQLWYNHLRTGHWLVAPITSGQYYQAKLDGNLWNGISGYLFSPGNSLFVYAPLLLVALTGVPALWRRHPAAAFHCVVPFVAWLLVHSRMHCWYGGFPLWGPRYFVTLMPSLMIPVAFALPRWWSSVAVGRPVLILLCAWGLLLQGAGTMVSTSYRLEHAIDQGWYDRSRYDDRFWWDPVHNEALDTLTAAWENVEVMQGKREPYSPRYADPLGVRAANTWNNWAVRFHLMGVPNVLTVALFAAFLAMALFGFAKVWAIVRSHPCPENP